MTLYQLLWQFIKQQKRRYALAGLMLFAVAALIVLIPRRVGFLVDGLVARQFSHQQLLIELGYLLLMGLAIYFLRIGWRMQLFAASYQLGVQLRTRLYQRLSQQGLLFFQNQATGDLMALGTNDADAIELASGEATLAGFDGSLTFALVLGMMILAVDWRLSLAALLPFPLMALAFKKITHKIHQASVISLDKFSTLNQQTQQTLSGVRTIRALGLEQRSSTEFANLTQEAAQASLQAQRWEAAYEPAVGLTLTAAGALVLGVGGYLVWQQRLSIGDLTSFSMYLGQLIWPMFAAGWVLSLLERGKAAWARLRPVLEQEFSVSDLGQNDQAPTGELRLDEVGLRYPGQSRPALAGISLRLQPGQTLGVVGPTGSGKTSLLSLILRQVELSQGQIYWGGQALADYPLSRLRQHINWVAQEPFLFSTSIANNIALGQPDCQQAAIQRAAQQAAVAEDIAALPEGFATVVGERGVTLSGGQRQRVAIARALLHNKPLLLLDDALSAVDSATENRILGHLAELRASRIRPAMIITSHRLSAVSGADHIIVLKHGQIIEQGDHQSLLALDGWYASQWRYQQLEASLDAA